jgi:hypothetical protein
VKPLPAIAFGLGVAVLAFGLAVATRDARDDAFADACGTLAVGDTGADAFLALGLDGYRPGCGDSLPCRTSDFGPHRDVRWACDGDDCSLLWRRGTSACYVDAVPDGEGLRVTGVVFQAAAE